MTIANFSFMHNGLPCKAIVFMYHKSTIAHLSWYQRIVVCILVITIDHDIYTSLSMMESY